MKKVFVVFTAIAGLLMVPALASAVCAEGELCVAPLGGVIADLYSYALSVVGLGVFVVFLAAGIAYVLPPSLRGKYLKDPNQLMWDAVAGTIILVSSVAILNIVNKDYTSFEGQAASSSGDSSGGSSSGSSTGTSSQSTNQFEKTTSRNGVTFRDTGSACSRATEPCVPGNSCIGSVCKLSPNGSLGVGEYCLSDAQCIAGAECVWATTVGGNKKCQRIQNANAEGM